MSHIVKKMTPLFGTCEIDGLPCATAAELGRLQAEIELAICLRSALVFEILQKLGLLLR